jgi:hypothetical protein
MSTDHAPDPAPGDVPARRRQRSVYELDDGAGDARTALEVEPGRPERPAAELAFLLAAPSPSAELVAAARRRVREERERRARRRSSPRPPRSPAELAEAVRLERSARRGRGVDGPARVQWDERAWRSS